jgi:hypothetical protein
MGFCPSSESYMGQMSVFIDNIGKKMSRQGEENYLDVWR